MSEVKSISFPCRVTDVRLEPGLFDEKCTIRLTVAGILDLAVGDDIEAITRFLFKAFRESTVGLRASFEQELHGGWHLTVVEE